MADVGYCQSQMSFPRMNPRIRTWTCRSQVQWKLLHLVPWPQRHPGPGRGSCSGPLCGQLSFRRKSVELNGVCLICSPVCFNTIHSNWRWMEWVKCWRGAIGACFGKICPRENSVGSSSDDKTKTEAQRNSVTCKRLQPLLSSEAEISIQSFHSPTLGWVRDFLHMEKLESWHRKEL